MVVGKVVFFLKLIQVFEPAYLLIFLINLLLEIIGKTRHYIFIEL